MPSVFFGLDSLEFITDNEAPYFADRDPAPGSIDHPITDPAIFSIKDDTTDVILSTVLLSNDLGDGVKLIYSGATNTWLNGYTGSVTPLTESGRSYYRFSITPPGGTWPQAQLLTFGAVAEDSLGNVMNNSFTASTLDDLDPVISDRNPGPGATDVAFDINISYKLTDSSGIDLTTHQVTVQGHDAVVDGVEQPGYDVTYVAIANGYEVIIDPDDDFLLFDSVQVVVDVDDIYSNSMATSTWTFYTPEGIFESPVLNAAAFEDVVRLSWSLPPPGEMRQELYQLRRSLTAFPTTPGEGELIYEGLDKTFDDDDVEVGVTYYYTVFVIQKYESGVPLYVPYEEPASDGAKPRIIPEPVIPQIEYVPARGDFGVKTFNPVAHGKMTAVWGQRQGTSRRTSDLITVLGGRPVRAPASGTIRLLESVSGSSDTRLKTIEVETPTGIVLKISGFLPTPSLVVGQGLEAGQAMGRTVPADVEFEIYKLPVGSFGRRVVNTRNFYLTLEKRNENK